MTEIPRGEAWMIRLTLGALAIGLVVYGAVKFLSPSRDAIALYMEQETGRRVYDSFDAEFVLQAHFVLLPAGRREARALEDGAFRIELRRLKECYDAAPGCSLSVLEFQRMLDLSRPARATSP